MIECPRARIRSGLSLKSIQPSAGSNPERTLPILMDRPHDVVAQAAGIR